MVALIQLQMLPEDRPSGLAFCKCVTGELSSNPFTTPPATCTPGYSCIDEYTSL